MQSNYGGILTIAGAPIGQELKQYYLREYAERPTQASSGREENPNGSIMVVVATNAPIDHRNLKRLAARALMGVART